MTIIRPHGMQTRSSDENSVCLSVCLSDKRVICYKPKDSCACILIQHEIHPSFVTRRMVGGGDSFYLKLWVKLIPLE